MEPDILNEIKQKALKYLEENKGRRGGFPPDADIVQDYIRGFIAGYGHKINKENKKNNN
jgi:hypothetical protein